MTNNLLFCKSKITTRTTQFLIYLFFDKEGQPYKYSIMPLCLWYDEMRFSYDYDTEGNQTRITLLGPSDLENDTFCN